jgi:hypothetical protein
MKETLEEAAEIHFKLQYLMAMDESLKHYVITDFIQGAKWQQEKLLEFINDEDNHTEGELGNSCIDVQSLIYFIKQFKKK